MIQIAHRGIYEFLWSEHKNSILSVSLKAFQGIASKLGKRPMILSLLKKFAEHAYDEETEHYNALLNAYDEVKKVLNRSERQLIMETLLVDEAETAKLIYELPLKYGEKVLSGCRLFFPREQGLYKFWDAQDKSGLWECFGPFQLHLTPQQVISKIAISTGVSGKEIIELLTRLSLGIECEEYNKAPEKLRTALQKHVMVAMPGGKSAWLNPRISVSELIPEVKPLDLDLLEASALALEKILDDAEYMPDVIGKMPEEEEFKNAFNREALPYIFWKDCFKTENAIEELKERFIQRLAIDNGHYSE